MKSVVGNRNVYRIKNKLALYFSEHRLHLIVCTIFIVIGISLGIYTAVKYSGEIALNNLSDSNLVDLLKGERGTMGMFFPYLFSFSLYCCVIVFLNFKPILCVFTYLALIIRGYLITFDITVLIILYGFAGIINVFLIILPCELIIWLILIFISAMSIKRNQNIKKFGAKTFDYRYGYNYKKVVWAFIIIGCFTLLLKCLLLPLIRVTIIVN